LVCVEKLETSVLDVFYQEL